MHTIACITVRMSSERLPGKVMADIAGKPALARIVGRYRQVQGLSDILVATTTDASDDAVNYWCNQEGVPCFRGSVDDVVDRIYHACRPYHADYVFRGLGDCTFIEPMLVEMMTNVVTLHQADTGRVFTSPNAWPVYGAAEAPYSWASIERMKEQSSGSQREHFGSHIDSNRWLYDIVYPCPSSGYYATYYRPFRLELDTETDLYMLCEIYKALGMEREPPLHEVISFLDGNLDLAMCNQHIAERTGPLTTYSPEQRADWMNYMNGRVVDWGGDWTWMAGNDGTRRAIWCDSGTCYLGYVERCSLFRPDGTRILGDAVIQCSCGANKRWREWQARLTR